MLSASFETFSALARLRRHVPVSGPRLAFALVLLFVGGALEGATIGLLVPLLAMLTDSVGSVGPFQARLDRLLDGVGLETRVLLLGAGILGLVALKNAVSYAGVATAGRLRAQAVVALRQKLLDIVLQVSPAALERHTSGEIVGVLTTEAWRVNRVLDQVVTLIHRSIIAASYLAAIVVLSWRLTLMTLLLGLVLGGVSQLFNRRALHFGRVLTDANLQLARYVTEVVGGLRVIRTTHTGGLYRESFERQSRTHADADVETSLSQALLLGAIETLGIAGAMGLTALAYAAWLKPGEINAATFLAFGFGLVRLLPALNQIYSGQGQVTALVGGLERVLTWFDLPRYPNRPFGDLRVPTLEQGIRFENLGFGYADGKDVLRGLSFLLPVGDTLAVLGASGSGKSTLAALLLRLREPTSGRILFDGIDHWQFAPEDFHRAVAFVEQEPFLFNATIADNVTCGLAGIGREAVLEALQRVQLGGFVDSLPDGIDTMVAERGATLSGGQRQRLAIARAIVRNPQVLVLDEPTSALDVETENEVVKAIDAASAGRTTIIITHRASTVQHATLCLNVESGRLEERGPRKAEPTRRAGS